eukprot:GFYU01015248.1.p1 GENE.GFYU01015248.1~~GFYU01015248.1.p1  ORF type:complete len:117 (-),score=39.33 GFYU01015248.1:111-461(-)
MAGEDDDETIVERIQSLDRLLGGLKKELDTRQDDITDEFYALREVLNRNEDIYTRIRELMRDLDKREKVRHKVDRDMRGEIEHHATLLREAIESLDRVHSDDMPDKPEKGHTQWPQ